MPSKYDGNVRAQATRLVRDHIGLYESEWAAVKTVAARLGMTPETLRRWLRQDQIDAGVKAGVSTAEAAQIRQLKRRNAELEQTIEILKAATAFFVRECDPQQR